MFLVVECSLVLVRELLLSIRMKTILFHVISVNVEKKNKKRKRLGIFKYNNKTISCVNDNYNNKLKKKKKCNFSASCKL